MWNSDGVVEWSATDNAGLTMPIDLLSTAQQRWVKLAVEIASIPDNCPIRLVCIDEPEAGLHRRAERFMARGLQKIVTSQSLTLVIATHSPEFLGISDARLHHVHRNANGKTEIESLTNDLRQHLEEFGLDKVDLLQMCRMFLVVEGQHDAIVLGELIGDDLTRMGVEVVALRGLRNLKNASDAQLLFRFTDASVLYLSDNENHDRVSNIWNEARNASPEMAIEILSEISKGNKNSEAVFLREFATLAHTLDAKERIHLAALAYGDIIEYLPLQFFVPPTSGHVSWSQVRQAFAGSGTKKSMKTWMSGQYGSDFSDETIRTAVRSMDDIPEEFTKLLAFVRSIIEESVRKDSQEL